MSQGQQVAGRGGSSAMYGVGRRTAVLCVVLMGVFALMTVLVLAGPGGKTRLEGSLGYPEAGPLPDMVAPAGTTGSAHSSVAKPHATASQSGVPGSLETLSGSGRTLTAAVAGGTATSAGGSRGGAGSTGSSAGKGAGPGGKGAGSGGKVTGSGGKSGGSGGSGGGKGSGGGTPGKPGGSGGSGKPGGSTGGSTGGAGGGSTGGPGGGSTGGSGGGSTGGSGGGSIGGSTGGGQPQTIDRTELLKQIEQQLLAWRAQMLAHEKELAQRLADQSSHGYPNYGPYPYSPRDTQPSYPNPSGHAYGRENGQHGHGHGR